MGKNKVILSIYYRHKQGGFTKRLYRAYQAIASAGYKLVYVSTELLPVKGENIQPDIIRLRAREGSLWYWPEFYLRSVLRLRVLLRQHDVRCFFIFSFFYASIAVLAGFGKHKDTIVFIRGDDIRASQAKSHRVLREAAHRISEWFGVHFAGRVITANHLMKQEIAARVGHARKIMVLPNDITLDRVGAGAEKKPDGDRLRLVTASVLNEGKNIEHVLAALENIQDFAWEYYIIGADVHHTGYEEKLRRWINEKNLAQNVRFLGWIDNVQQKLKDCDLFVFPSKTEGSPNALLEALGCELPCLGSDIPEIREVLDDPELVFVLDDPGELAGKISRFAKDETYRALVRQKSLSCRDKFMFDWDQRIVDLVSA